MIDEVGQTVPQPQKDEAREKNKEKRNNQKSPIGNQKPRKPEEGSIARFSGAKTESYFLTPFKKKALIDAVGDKALQNPQDS